MRSTKSRETIFTETAVRTGPFLLSSFNILGDATNLLLLRNDLICMKETAAETFWTHVAGGRCVFRFCLTLLTERDGGVFLPKGKTRLDVFGRKALGVTRGGHVNVSRPAFHVWKLIVAKENMKTSLLLDHPSSFSPYLKALSTSSPQHPPKN
jgi:hypothetical protein